MQRVKRQIEIAGSVAFVPLTKGYTAIVDAACVALVAGFNWSAQEDKRADGTIRTVYALRLERGKKIRMHRAITGARADMEVDHINGDGLDNRLKNLRAVSHAENLTNQRKKVNNRSGFKGVSPRPNGTWQAKIVKDGMRRHLGTFARAEDAHMAYAAASAELHGEFGRLD